MTEDLAQKYGVPFYPLGGRRGERRRHDARQAAVIGGEGNGGVIDPRVGLVRDSFVGMALVLDAMAARELPVSALADELPRYAIHKTKIDLAPEKIPAAYAALEKNFPIRNGRPARRPAARLADTRWWRQLAARPSEQHRADRAHHCRSADCRRSEAIV